jgi:DNA-binding NarL/FixJ family response regulator
MNKKGSALIIASPSQLRASLQVLLTTIPQIERVDLVDSGPAALALSAEYLPTLVLLDLSSSDYQTAATLKQLRTKWPHGQYIVLVDNEQGEQLAISAKAEVVLIKGVPAAKLLATIEVLLSQ